MSEVGMDNELRFSVAAVGSVKKDLLLKLGWKADPATDIENDQTRIVAVAGDEEGAA